MTLKVKTVPAILVALALALPATQAKSALIFYVIGIEKAKHDDEWGGLPWAFASTTVGVLGLGAVFFNPAVGGGLIILGEEGPYDGNDLSSLLHETYPFIEDQYVVDDLAAALESEIAAAGALAAPSKTPITVSVPRETIIDILAPTDLSDEKIGQIVSDLAPVNVEATGALALPETPITLPITDILAPTDLSDEKVGQIVSDHE